MANKQYKTNSVQTALLLKMGSIGFPETSASNYQSSLCKVTEERRSHLHGSESLESRDAVSC